MLHVADVRKWLRMAIHVTSDFHIIKSGSSGVSRETGHSISRYQAWDISKIYWLNLRIWGFAVWFDTVNEVFFIKQVWFEIIMIHLFRWQFSDCNGCCSEPSWYQLWWNFEHSEVFRLISTVNENTVFPISLLVRPWVVLCYVGSCLSKQWPIPFITGNTHTHTPVYTF